MGHSTVYLPDLGQERQGWGQAEAMFCESLLVFPWCMDEVHRDPTACVEDGMVFIWPPGPGFALCSALETRAHGRASWNKFGGDFRGHWDELLISHPLFHCTFVPPLPLRHLQSTAGMGSQCFSRQTNASLITAIRKPAPPASGQSQLPSHFHTGPHSNKSNPTFAMGLVGEGWAITFLDDALQEITLCQGKIHKGFSNMALAVHTPLSYLELTACD